VCQQCNSLRATEYVSDDGPCEIDAFHVIVEETHETGVVEPGTAQKAALKAVFVYIV
jgi:hypothetical protein